MAVCLLGDGWFSLRMVRLLGHLYSQLSSFPLIHINGGKELPRLPYKTSWTNTLSTLEGHVHHSSLYSTDHHTLWSELGPLDPVDRSAYLLNEVLHFSLTE